MDKQSVANFISGWIVNALQCDFARHYQRSSYQHPPRWLTMSIATQSRPKILVVLKQPYSKEKRQCQHAWRKKWRHYFENVHNCRSCSIPQDRIGAFLYFTVCAPPGSWLGNMTLQRFSTFQYRWIGWRWNACCSIFVDQHCNACSIGILLHAKNPQAVPSYYLWRLWA